MQTQTPASSPGDANKYAHLFASGPLSLAKKSPGGEVTEREIFLREILQ